MRWSYEKTEEDVRGGEDEREERMRGRRGKRGMRSHVVRWKREGKSARDWEGKRNGGGRREEGEEERGEEGEEERGEK